MILIVGLAETDFFEVSKTSSFFYCASMFQNSGTAIARINIESISRPTLEFYCTTRNHGEPRTHH